MARSSSRIFQRVAGRFEMAGEFVGRHPAVEFHAAESGVAGLGHGGIGNVDAQDADVVAPEIAKQFLENDGGAVSFLSGGTGGAEDADGHGAEVPTFCAGR